MYSGNRDTIGGFRIPILPRRRQPMSGGDIMLVARDLRAI